MECHMYVQIDKAFVDYDDESQKKNKKKLIPEPYQRDGFFAN